MAAGGLFIIAQPAAAAAPLNCLNTIYVTSSSGTIRQVDLTTRTLVTAQPYAALPTGAGTTANQIGIGAGGAIALHGTTTSIVRYTPALDQTTVVAKPSGVGSGTVGAVNPLTGLFYYGAYTGNVLNLYVYNPASTTSTPGIVAAVTVNNAPGANGDIAFDEAGRLYMVAGDGATPFQAALYRMNGTVPTTPATPASTFTSTEISRGANTGGTNGIAFASDGYLYISTGTAIRQLNPITGATVGTDISLPGAGITDLGTCAGPSSVQLGTDFPDGRANPSDQFGVSLTGTDYVPGAPTTGTGPKPPPTGQTSGSTPSASTEPSIVLPSQDYQLVQTPVGTTNPNNYVTTYQCTTLDGTVIASGNGSPGTITVPAGTDGNSITCAFRNDLPVPSIDLTKTVSPTSFSAAGQVLTYTFTIRNTGNTVLNTPTLFDPMPGLGAPSCTPATATLQPNATVTCTATYTVIAADISAAAPKVNTATVAGTPPTGQGATVSDTSTASAGFVATPPTATNDSGAAAFNQSVTLASSTNDTPGNGPINPALTVLTAAGATNGGKTLTTAQGVFNVQPDGTIVFTPAPGYVGTTPAVQYRITDSNGLSATATVTATVRPGPVANPNTGTTNQDQNHVVNVLGNDTPGPLANNSPGAINLTSVVFPTAGQPTGAQVTDGGRTLTVTDQGVYTADPVTGVVTFDPAPTFIGPATPVAYSFTDSNGNSASSTITITVTAVNPVAIDDTANTVFGTAVTLPAGTNDLPGPGGAIDQALTVFTSGSATNGGKTLVTPEGTWQVQPDGTVVFDPAAGYVGTTPTVEYRITDTNGQTDTATLQVTVRPGPTAAPDATTTPQNVTVSLPVLDNDVAGLEVDGSAGTLNVGSVAFQTTGLPAGSAASADRHTLTVPGEGVYTFDPATAQVTFDPEPQFTGVASPVAYTVLDQSGNVAVSTITITVTAITPSATDDATKTPSNTPVELNVAANDTPGAASAPIVPGSILFTSPAATQNGTVLTVAGEGTWEIVADGTVRFTPEPTFSGNTTAVEYSVADANGTTAVAEIVVVVGGPPLAAPDADSTPQNTAVTLEVLGNDKAGDLGAACTEPGVPAGCDTGTLVVSSVVFPAAGQPANAVISDDGKTITVPGEGVWTIDGTTGAITFDPEAAFTGVGQVSYAVTDSYGQTATTTATVTVRPITPDAINDTAQTPFNTPVQLSGVLNDVAGVDTVDPTVTSPLQPALTVFPTTGQPADVEISDDGKTLTVPNQGTYEIAADGSVTFTPVDGYVGTTTSVTYRIEDANGTTATATLAVTVRPGPAAATDVVGSDPTQPVLQGQPVTINPLTNDTPSQNADGTPGAFLPETVVFPTTGQPAGAEVTDGGKTLTVPGEGTYTVNPDGTVTFQPEPGFSGPTTPVGYEVTDTHGNATGSTIVVVVKEINPTAVQDLANTPFDTPVTFPFAANDVAGDPVAPIVPASATFEPADQPEDAEISGGGKILTVPGEGSYTLNDDGTVTFEPVPGFSGAATPVTYTIRDANGTSSPAQLLVTVRPGPAAAPDTDTTPQNVPVDTAVLGNDTPGLLGDGNDGDWDQASVVFPASGQPAGAEVAADGKSVTVPNEGTYTVIDVDGTAEIRFTPVPTFRGGAAPVTYAVTDTNGNTASSTLTVTVEGIDPVAENDAAITPFDTPVLINTKLNDAAGAATAPLVDAATVFPGEGQPAGAIILNDGKVIEIPEQGTYVVNNDGTVTFTPVPGFSGITTPVIYQIADSNGTTDTATITVTVRPGPDALDDTGDTKQNVTVTVNVLNNDVPGRDVDDNLGIWQPTSVVFPVDGQPAGATVTDEGKTLTVPGEGVYTVEPDGQITFDPEPQFSGVATGVVYSVTDSLNNPATAVLTITVEAIVPTATRDDGVTPFNTPVTLPGVQNDSAGDVTAPLVPGATVFPTAGQPDGAIVAPDGKSIEVPGQGTYVLDDEGQITFNPVPGYEGTTTPVTYQIEDTNGTTDANVVSVIVREGPTAAPDEETTPQNVNVDIDVTTNDQTGLNVDGVTRADWDFSSLVFPTDGQPAGATVTDEGRTLTVPGEGVYTADPETGIVTFDPEPQFRSTTTPVTYQVADSLGNPVQSTISVIVTPIDPEPTNDRLPTPFNTPITLPGALNDAPGADTAPLVPEATFFPEAGQPEGAVRSDDGKTLEVPNQGTWAVNEDGSVTFTPVDGFVGTTTPVLYQVVDTNGTTAPEPATLVVDVRQGPSASSDAGTTPQNIPVTVPVLANDTAGLNADSTSGALLPETVVFTEAGQPEGAELSEDGKTLVVPGQGTWTATPDGTITFTPEPQFVGETTPVVYEVTDSLGNPAQATVVVTVTPIVPTATDDLVRTPFNTPVTLPGMVNDLQGADTAPLVPSETYFVVLPTPIDVGENAPVITVSEDRKTATVENEGTFVINADGTVTFTPVDGFVGTTTSVPYLITDRNGTTANALLTVIVQPGPTAAPNTGTGLQGKPVTVNPIEGDVPGPNADGSTGAFDPTTVVFPTQGQPQGAQVSTDGRTLTLPGVGVFTADPVTGLVTFTPEPQFVGATPPVTYQVSDSHGNPATSTIVIEIAGVTPVAANDAASTPYNTPVTLDVLANDGPGSAEIPLDPSTLVLLDGAGTPVTTLVVPGEGTWTVVDGTLVFTPEPGFTGTTTPVTYQVSDVNGTPVTATAVVEVRTEGAAQPDRTVTAPATGVTVPVLDNDQAAQGEEFLPDTLCVVAADGECVKTVVRDGVGTWQVNPDGSITFTPVPGFSGEATIEYRVTDTGGNVYSADLTVAVDPAPATPDKTLPKTGGVPFDLMGWGLVLLLLGAALVLRTRRRTS